MKMVSAAKFRRAQNAILGMRPYSAQLNEIMGDIDVEDGVQTPYHDVRKLDSVLLVVVTSNKGLCGAFNSNVIKQAQARIDHYTNEEKAGKLSMITIGKRATEFFSKRKGLVVGSHDELLDKPAFDSVATLADEVMERFCAKEYDRIESGKEGKKRNDYIYEPSKEEILKEMVPLTLRSHFYRVVLDSLAAEHGARMNAMQKATDNATELLKELKLSYNKARQAAITNEIIEIVSGSEALKG